MNPLKVWTPISLLNLKQLLLNNREKGIGCFLSSHMLDIAEKISDHIIFIKKGKILYNGAFEDLKNSWPNIESLDELYFKLYNQGANGKNK